MARYNREAVEKSYRQYVTNSLRLIPQMSYIQSMWTDIVDGGRMPDRTASEIIDDVVSRLEAL